MKAHVICLDDTVEYVVIDDLVKAEEKIKELARAYYDNRPWCWNSYTECRQQCYWYIQTVEAE